LSFFAKQQVKGQWSCDHYESEKEGQNKVKDVTGLIESRLLPAEHYSSTKVPVALDDQTNNPSPVVNLLHHPFVTKGKLKFSREGPIDHIKNT
jgi:hypothetical protein